MIDKKLKVKCPKCTFEFNYYDSEFRPFCSERCRNVDLGHWFEESYKVPVKTPLSIVEQGAQSADRVSDESEHSTVENQEEIALSIYPDSYPTEE